MNGSLGGGEVKVSILEEVVLGVVRPWVLLLGEERWSSRGGR